ncbi:MAG: biopolymer transporter ExbD [Saprospiraceae bacterium]|nr:biopolymer transporter ExbD [Saprospiraceae bacterium]
MPKIKMKRQNIRMDMTAMCDVAFLLLTFFILTTKFRPNEAVQVDIPGSTAQIPLPEKDVLLITVGKVGDQKDDRIFFGVDDQNTRMGILDELAKEFNFTVDGEMQKRFKLLDQFGVPLDQLPQLLKMDPVELANFKQPGLPCNPDAKLMAGQTGSDTAKNHLGKLIIMARTLNPNLRIAVKADKSAEYGRIDDVIETLRKTNSNRFNLITSAKAGAAPAHAE